MSQLVCDFFDDVSLQAELIRLNEGRLQPYYALHATLDVKHSRTWNTEVIAPLVAENPTCRFAIAEGALMRLTAGARCFAKYRLALEVMR